jgi:hypothetical protein
MRIGDEASEVTGIPADEAPDEWNREELDVDEEWLRYCPVPGQYLMPGVT